VFSFNTAITDTLEVLGHQAVRFQRRLVRRNAREHQQAALHLVLVDAAQAEQVLQDLLEVRVAFGFREVDDTQAVAFALGGDQDGVAVRRRILQLAIVALAEFRVHRLRVQTRSSFPM
jgi:hypothetical protein